MNPEKKFDNQRSAFGARPLVPDLDHAVGVVLDRKARRDLVQSALPLHGNRILNIAATTPYWRKLFIQKSNRLTLQKAPCPTG